MTRARRMKVWGVEDELDDDMAHIYEVEVTWVSDVDAFLQERSQQAAFVAGHVGGGTAETIGSFERGMVDETFVPVGRTDGAPR